MLARTASVAALVCSAALLVAFAFARRAPDGERAMRRASVDAVHGEAAASDPLAYHRDRGRRLEGRVVDSERRPVAARVSAVDAIALGQQWVALTGAGARAWLDARVEASELGASSASDGVFLFRGLPVGVRMLFFDAPGYAPLRTQDVIQRDGLGTWNAGGTLRPASRLDLSIDALGTAASARVRLVYRGAWPGLEWQEVRAGDVLALERRDPDGYPCLIALDRGAGIEWLELAEAEAGASASGAASADATPALRALSELRAWQPQPEAWIGAPQLCHRSTSAIACALGLCAPDAVASEAGATELASAANEQRAGTLALQADMAFSAIELLAPDGVRRSAWSDAYGEVVFSGLGSGFHFARTTLVGGGRSAWRGVVLSNEGFARIKFTTADGAPGGDDAVPALVGCVRRLGEHGAPLRDAVVAWYGRVEAQRSPYGSARTDEHGYFRIPGLLPGELYRLEVRAHDARESAITVVEAVMSNDATEHPRGILAELPDTGLRVLVGEHDRDAKRRLLIEPLGAAPLADAASGAQDAHVVSEGAIEIDLATKPHVDLDGWTPGQYRLSLRERGREVAARTITLKSGEFSAPIDFGASSAALDDDVVHAAER